MLHSRYPRDAGRCRASWSGLGVDRCGQRQRRSRSSVQRQLIALARAQLVNPAVLLLHEATANLDLNAEAKVRDAMAAVSANRTTVLVAHRLPTARTADRIIVLADGRIVEEGDHDTLVRNNRRYAEMWAAHHGVHS